MRAVGENCLFAILAIQGISACSGGELIVCSPGRPRDYCVQWGRTDCLFSWPSKGLVRAVGEN